MTPPEMKQKPTDIAIRSVKIFRSPSGPLNGTETTIATAMSKDDSYEIDVPIANTEKLEITEGMFISFLSGILLIRDSGSIRNYEKISMGDAIQIKLDSLDTTVDDRPNEQLINGIIVTLNDHLPTTTSTAKGLAITFASPSFVLGQYLTDHHLTEEYYGKIAKYENSEDDVVASETDEVPSARPRQMVLRSGSPPASDPSTWGEGEEGDEDTSNKEEDVPLGNGFINKLIKNHLLPLDNQPYEIEETQNTMWFRDLIPTKFKNLGGSTKCDKLYDLIYDAEKFSCHNTNHFAFNFFFWQDMDGYHYRSVESLLSEQEEVTPDKEYVMGVDLSSIEEGSGDSDAWVFLHSNQGNENLHKIKNRIYDISVDRTPNLLELFDGSLFSCWYQYWTKPRPDLDQLDTVDVTSDGINFEMTKPESLYSSNYNLYSFSYIRDHNKWKKVEARPIFYTHKQAENFSINIPGILNFESETPEGKSPKEHIGDSYTNDQAVPSTGNFIEPQLFVPRFGGDGYQIDDNSPISDYYNFYKHSALPIQDVYNINSIKKPIMDSLDRFWWGITALRYHIWDEEQKANGCNLNSPVYQSLYGQGGSSRVNSGWVGMDMGGQIYDEYLYDEPPVAYDPDTELPIPTESPDITPAATRPSCITLGLVAENIPHECPLIEWKFGDQWFGNFKRDYFYYGSYYNKTPTAANKDHTNAELTFFKYECGNDPLFQEYFNVTSTSSNEDWEDAFPGLFSKGALCASEGCQGNSMNAYRYMEVDRTFSRYFDTPDWAPIYRNASVGLLQSQEVTVKVAGDLQRKPGHVINIKVPVTQPQDPETDPAGIKRNPVEGRYLVTSISHTITPSSHIMSMILNRDSTPSEENESGRIGGSVDVESLYKVKNNTFASNANTNNTSLYNHHGLLFDSPKFGGIEDINPAEKGISTNRDDRETASKAYRDWKSGATFSAGLKPNYLKDPLVGYKNMKLYNLDRVSSHYDYISKMNLD